MKAFANLLDSLTFEPSRDGKLRLMSHYFATTADPDRGHALAALTGAFAVTRVRPALIRTLISARTDPVLFALSHDYAGDLLETVALIWPTPAIDDSSAVAPSLAKVIEILTHTGKTQLPGVLSDLLDSLDETSRWALLKLVTGGLRVGVSAQLARMAVAQINPEADLNAGEIEELWPSLSPPYSELFAWIEGRGERPAMTDPAPFRPPMLAHALAAEELAQMNPKAFVAEWKWDGARVQASAGYNADGVRVARLFSRSGDDISAAFPDIMATLMDPRFGETSIDGELLVMPAAGAGCFSDLQQRLNRKKPDRRVLADHPAHIRAYDILRAGGQDLRVLPFARRREELESFAANLPFANIDLSPLIDFANWNELERLRANPPPGAAGAAPVEGLMIKRRDSPYLAGRPKNGWFKWKRDPFNVDAVLMYAQRGQGQHAALYCEYTIGIWRDSGNGAELVPVGKVHSGCSDAELKKLDQYVRETTLNRFGPVREVAASREAGLVFEIDFEGLQRSPRRKAGIVLRAPRIARIRWDKQPKEAGTLGELEKLLD